MQKQDRRLAERQRNYQRTMDQKKLTNRDLDGMVPPTWKERARVAQTSKILLPIKGSGHYA